jgi:phosphate transport system substrate-binding protein
MRLELLKNVIRRHLVVASVSAIAMISFQAAAEEIRIGGTGNALGTMHLLVDAFVKLHPETKPVVLSSIGTSGAIKAVSKGAIEIGLSSRPLTEEEIRTGLTSTEYARSATVFAVQDQNKVTSITSDQIAAIYSGHLSKWPDGTAIRPVLRQPGDDNTRQIRNLSAMIDKSLAIAEKRPGQIFASTDQEAADKMESIPGSLGVTTVALIRSEKRNLRALALDGVEPTPENANSGRYSMVKQFNFVLPKEPSSAVQEFVKFVRSPQGRKVLEQTGHAVR